MDLFSLLSLKKTSILYKIPQGTNIPDWLTNRRSFRIRQLLFDLSADQMLWEEYRFHVLDFNWSFNQSAV